MHTKLYRPNKKLAYEGHSKTVLSFLLIVKINYLNRIFYFILLLLNATRIISRIELIFPEN